MQQSVGLGRRRVDDAEIEQHVDPVCKMTVTPATAAASYDYQGKTYYFCMVGCRDRFAANPERFITQVPSSGGVEARADDQREYTCPMHPEIVQIGPGSCPICGMALEPKEITLDDTPDPEYLDMRRRFWISAILTLPVFLLAMAEMLPNFHQFFSPQISIWTQFILATPVVLWGGWPFFQRA